jgi:hypothetical protein
LDFNPLQNDTNGSITASGTIEATIVNVAPETAGKVTDVRADEGESVTKGQPLLHLDPSLLTAQRPLPPLQWTLPTPPSPLPKPNMTKRSKPLLLLSCATLQRLAGLAPSEFDQPNWYIEQDATDRSRSS